MWGGRPSDRAALLAHPSWFVSHSLSYPSPGLLAPHVAARPGWQCQQDLSEVAWKCLDRSPGKGYHCKERYEPSHSFTQSPLNLPGVLGWVSICFLGAFCPELAKHCIHLCLPLQEGRKGISKASCHLLQCESCLSGPWVCEMRAGRSHSCSKCLLLPKCMALQRAAGAVSSGQGYIIFLSTAKPSLE